MLTIGSASWGVDALRASAHPMISCCASRHALLSSPVTAALRTDWRYCFRRCLAVFRASIPASIWEKSCSILATICFCCSGGASGNGNYLKFVTPNAG